MSSYLKGVFSTTPASSAYVPPTIGSAPGIPVGVVKKKKTTKLGFGSAVRPAVTETSSVAGSRFEDDRISVADSQPTVTIESAEKTEVTIDTPETAVTPEVVEGPKPDDVPSQKADDPKVMEDPQPVPSDSISPLITSLAELVGTYTTLTDRQTSLRSEKMKIEASISQLVIRQNEFCEAENFDSADQLNVEIDTLRNSLVDVISELYSEIPKKMNQLKNEQELLMDEIKHKVDQQESILKDQMKEAESVFETTKNHLQTQLETIATVDQMFSQQTEDIGVRKSVLQGRQDEVENLIAQESEKLETEKSEAESEYQRLDELIGDLQAQLAAAMAARSDCAMTISATHMKLKNIRAKFANVSEELADERDQIEQEESELLDAKIAAGGGDVKQVEHEIDCTTRSHETEMNSFEVLQSSLIIQKKDLTEFFDSLNEFITSCAPAADEFVSACEYTRFLNESVVELELKLSEFKTSLISARETELPALEAAKKVAIANRAFRDAKEIAEEIKRISDDLSLANEKHAELKSRLVSARAELQEARLVEDKMREELNQLEVEKIEILENAKSHFISEILSLRESNYCRQLVEKVTFLDNVSE